MIHRLLLGLLFTLSLSAVEPLSLRTQMHMGTLVTISLPREQLHLAQKAFERIHEIEMALSSYNPKAEIYRLNAGERVKVSPYTREALRLSQRYFRESEGYFDITVGSITKRAFHFGEEERVPALKQLDDAKIDIQGLHVKGDTVFLDEGIVLDLGGMGKGYAVDEVAAYLQGRHVNEGIIAASGDIRCLGVCSIEIQNPFEEGVIGRFKTKQPNMAVSTSGNYRRYVTDKTHNHLIDPKAKRPQQRFASITLIGSRPNSDLDAYATAASVMPFEKALVFLKAQKVAYILITTDKQLFVSEHIEAVADDLKLGAL